MEAYHKKNFQVRDVKHDSIIFPDRFLLEAISNYSALCNSFRSAVPFVDHPKAKKYLLWRHKRKISNDYFTYDLFLSHGG